MSNLLNRTADEIIINEAKAWTIKYLMAASEVFGFILKKIIGINDIRLISKPIQAINQEEEEQTIRVLIVRVNIRDIFKNLKKI